MVEEVGGDGGDAASSSSSNDAEDDDADMEDDELKGLIDEAGDDAKAADAPRASRKRKIPNAGGGAGASGAASTDDERGLSAERVASGGARRKPAHPSKMARGDDA